MKLVIDIPKDMYEGIKQLKIQYPRGSVKANQLDFYYGLLTCLKQGVPLPKGHGRLIDANNITFSEFFDAGDYAQAMRGIYNAPTIIEADNRSEE